MFNYKNCDCSSCKDYRNNPYNFIDLYGAKYYGKKIDTSSFKSIDDYCKSMREERMLKIAELCSARFDYGDIVTFYKNGQKLEGMIDGKGEGPKGILYTIKTPAGYFYYLNEDEMIFKGKDNNMTQVQINVDCVGAIKYGTEKSFFITGPKFNTGDKIKFENVIGNWKQGVIYSLNKKVTISKCDGSTNYKADNLQWFYTIIESGNLKTWNGIKEDNIKIDDTPDYNKYFKMLGAHGLSFKQEDFTIVSWESSPIFGVVGFIEGYNNKVVLKPKFNDHKTVVNFWCNHVNKLPSISEKC